jgi:hypothetical protein
LVAKARFEFRKTGLHVFEFHELGGGFDHGTRGAHSGGLCLRRAVRHAHQRM